MDRTRYERVFAEVEVPDGRYARTSLYGWQAEGSLEKLTERTLGFDRCCVTLRDDEARDLYQAHVYRWAEQVAAVRWGAELDALVYDETIVEASA